MNTTNYIKEKLRRLLPGALLSLISILLLTGCAGIVGSFSPEAAAQQEVINNPNPNMRVDPNSVQILQRIQLNDKTMVMLSFSGSSPDMGQSSCLFMYEVFRMPLGGWNTGSGGGGCVGGGGNPADEGPFSVGAGISSGGRPMDPGYSTVYGQVFVPEIRTIKVTWKDGEVQEVGVINASYLAGRTGQVEMSKVEGFNAENELVHSSDPEVDPQKQLIEEESDNAKP